MVKQKHQSIEFFSPKNEKRIPGVYDQVNQCFGSMTISLVSTTGMMSTSCEEKELWITHDCRYP